MGMPHDLTAFRQQDFEEGRQMLEYKIRSTGDITILDLEGRISLTDALWSASGVVLGKVIRELLKKGERKILLNLKGVTYVDSSGIGELTGALTAVQRQGGELKLVNPNPKVVDLLRITRLDTMFDIRDDENSAIQSFSSRIAAA
jgi:anti-sigma B factor antagonist